MSDGDESNIETNEDSNDTDVVCCNNSRSMGSLSTNHARDSHFHEVCRIEIKMISRYIVRCYKIK